MDRCWHQVEMTKLLGSGENDHEGDGHRGVPHRHKGGTEDPIINFRLSTSRPQIRRYRVFTPPPEFESIAWQPLGFFSNDYPNRIRPFQ